MTRAAVELSSGSWPGSKSSVYLARQSAIPQTSQCQHWSLALCSARPDVLRLVSSLMLNRLFVWMRLCTAADATASAAAATSDPCIHDASDVDMQYAHLLYDGVWISRDCRWSVMRQHIKIVSIQRRYAAPRSRNSALSDTCITHAVRALTLPTQLRESDITRGQFRRALKTHLLGH